MKILAKFVTSDHVVLPMSMFCCQCNNRINQTTYCLKFPYDKKVFHNCCPNMDIISVYYMTVLTVRRMLKLAVNSSIIRILYFCSLITHQNKKKFLFFLVSIFIFDNKLCYLQIFSQSL